MKVIADTSFLLRLAGGPIKGLTELETAVGKLEYLVPRLVLDELRSLSRTRAAARGRQAGRALEYAQTLPLLRGPSGGAADDQILAQAKGTGLAVATLDRLLIGRLRELHIKVVTCRRDRVVLEGALP